MSVAYHHKWIRLRLPAHLRDAVDEINELIQARIDDGVICPCCSRNVKKYTYTINGPMCRSLAWIVNRTIKNGGKWIKVTRVAPLCVVRCPERAKLRYWGLIEEKPNKKDPTRKSTGMWRATKKGIMFFHGKIKVHKAVVVYNRTVLERLGPDVTYRERLGKRFDYEKLMKGIYE